ncbi:MAG TPA: hypothetical protein PKW49_02090 [Paludibacteraceae bacterium]|jgi:hypothetical protein|nr:hypothetical protein [Paludibacteraceae bacterium]HQF49505.1 hypothetical protein [Paludibacteraceae bacterium]HQJ89678.1 hypothetical protein [Paludibacteraceae bacterium]
MERKPVFQSKSRIFPFVRKKSGIFDLRLEEKRAFFVGIGGVQGVVPKSCFVAV